MMYKILARLALSLHTIAYKLSSKLATKAEKGLHPKHRIMRYHDFFVEHTGEMDTVLDVGCGNGALAFDVAKKAKRVIGIDVNEKNIEKAKQKYSASNIEYTVGDATKDVPGQSFDVVILSNVLEHIEDRTLFLNRIKKIAPKILIRVPMFDRDWITLYKKELGVEWRLDKTHYIEYTLEEFQEEMKQVNLEIIDYTIQFGELWATARSKY